MLLLFTFLICAHSWLGLRSSAYEYNVPLLNRRGSISFENADITALIKMTNGEIIAEAFNATAGIKDITKMRWVSLGIPRLLVRKDGIHNSTVSAIKFVPGGFYIFIETLSTEVAKELSKEASQKYEVNIKSSQFLPIDKHIGNLECLLKLFLSDNESFVKIIGKAEVIANPIAVFFELPYPNRKYIDIIQNLTNPVVFQCNIKLNSRYHNDNSLKPNASTIEVLNPLEKLINGGQTVVNIIRDQLLKWSSRAQTTMSTFNEQFSLTTEDFRVTDIVSQCAEAVEQRAIGRFNAVLNATANIRDSINQTLQEIKQMERNTSTRIECAFAMSTRDDYMNTMLRGANISACSGSLITGAHSFALFTHNGTFTVPPGVHSVNVLAVGGGAGGGSGYFGGGGSGYVRLVDLTVTPLTQIKVTVGRGGRGSSLKNDDTQTGGGGGRSTFGCLLSADGGFSVVSYSVSSNGGSGGGAPWVNSGSGTSGAGGTDGGNGGSSTYGGGTGQGTYSDRLRVFKLNTLSAGSGGAGASGVHIGGGGGGGILINGKGPSGGRGEYGNTFGGNGYGAGGAGGYYPNTNPQYGGGDGADGLVYIEW